MVFGDCGRIFSGVKREIWNEDVQGTNSLYVRSHVIMEKNFAKLLNGGRKKNV